VLHRIWAPYRRPPNLGCGGSLAVLSSCSSTWGALCSRLRPDHRYAGVCALRTARFPISCGMFSIAVLNLQERLLRRRSDGVNVSRVVSGIRCHRSGLLSWFHNVRVLACTGRPYSGERCCSSAITREKNSLVRRDSLLREQFGVRPAPQLSRACATACVVRPQRDFLPPCLLRQRARRNLLRVSSARPAPLWPRMAGII